MKIGNYKYVWHHVPLSNKFSKSDFIITNHLILNNQFRTLNSIKVKTNITYPLTECFVNGTLEALMTSFVYLCLAAVCLVIGRASSQQSEALPNPFILASFSFAPSSKKSCHA